MTRMVVKAPICLPGSKTMSLSVSLCILHNEQSRSLFMKHWQKESPGQTQSLHCKQHSSL